MPADGEWKRLSLEGAFELHVPNDAEGKLDDGGTMFVVRLRTAPATEVLIGSFDFDEEKLRKLGRRSLVEAEARRFIERIVLKGSGEGSFETSLRADGYMCQALAKLDGDGWWIARTYCRKSGLSFFLLHWNGPERYLKDPVLRILESFEPVLPEG